MFKSLPVILGGLLLLSTVGTAADGAERVNALRRAAGLPLLEQNPALTLAAQRHAAYLDRNREPGISPGGLSAHTEQPGLPGFTGERPVARALAAGYPHREVLENVSMGYDSMPAALDGLMSAIYHRLTFLDLESDQLGVAEGEHSRVFLMGRSDHVALCASPPADALFLTPMDCLGQSMTRAYYDEICRTLGPEARFRPAHSASCPNGKRLDAAYMEEVCASPPPQAAFLGFGRYYRPCEDGTRIDAAWFDSLCESPPAEAAYPASGSYYEICEPTQRVFAEWFESTCANLPARARYTDSGRYRRPCAEQTDVRVEYLDQLDRDRQQTLPEVVIWPPDGADKVPPAFFVEEPDPLPDLDVAGFPISIQFNPAFVEEPILKAFRLWRIDGEQRFPVEGLRLLDAKTDPHNLLTSHEFALFPLERLDWASRYEVEVEALVDGRPFKRRWQFSTAGARLPLLKADQARQRFFVPAGKPVLLYLPPRDHNPHTVLSSRTEHLRGNRVTLEVVDPNTLKVTVDARFCDRIKIAFDGAREVELVPSGCAG